MEQLATGLRFAVSDHGWLSRDGLCLQLQSASQRVVHSVSSGDGLDRLIAADPVDVALLEVRTLPGCESGIVTARRLRWRFPFLAILLLDHHRDGRPFNQAGAVAKDRIGYACRDHIPNVAALIGVVDQLRSGQLARLDGTVAVAR